MTSRVRGTHMFWIKKRFYGTWQQSHTVTRSVTEFQSHGHHLFEITKWPHLCSPRFPSMGVPRNGWFCSGNPNLKYGWLGVAPFKPPKYHTRNEWKFLSGDSSPVGIFSPRRPKHGPDVPGQLTPGDSPVTRWRSWRGVTGVPVGSVPRMDLKRHADIFWACYIHMHIFVYIHISTYIYSHPGVDRTWKFQTNFHFSEDWTFTHSICSRTDL